MKFSPSFLNHLMALLLAFTFFQCEKDALQADMSSGNAALQTRDSHIPDVLCKDLCADIDGATLVDFSDLTPDKPFPDDYNGVTLSAVSTDGTIPLKVWVFDTDRTLEEAEQCAKFDDDDLLFPDGPFGNVLVIQDENVNTCANDRRRGGIVTVDYRALGTVTINCLTFFDTEEVGSYEGQKVSGALLVYDEDGNRIGDFIPIPAVPDGGATVVEVGISGIAFFQVVFLGSGAVSSICLSVDDNNPGCTYTQGYWKNHEEDWCVPTGTTFNDCSGGWLDILHTPVKGDAYYILAHQYIAAYLNEGCVDADTDDVEDAYSAAAAWLASHCPGEDLSKEEKEMITGWAGHLDQFNNGLIGPGHCDETEPE